MNQLPTTTESDLVRLSDPSAAGPPVPRRPRRTRPTGVMIEAAALPACLMAICVLFSVMLPDTFATQGNISSVLASQAVLVVLSLGLVIPMTAGDYDLSIAGVLSLSAMLIAVLNVNQGWPIVAACLAAIVAGVLIGLANGLLVTGFGIDPFIVTLGMSTVLGGVVLLISDSNTISGVDPGLVDAVILTRLFGIPLEFYYGMITCAVVFYVIGHTPFGRQLLVIGQRRSVARLSGIRVDRMRVIALMISGGVAAIAGILYVGTFGSADPSSGTTQLLPAFAAVFLGATAIRPGRFNAVGTVVAVYFLVIGINGLQLLGASAAVQPIFYGGALVVAVTLSQLAKGKARRRTDPN